MVSFVVHMFAMGRASHLFWNKEAGLAKTENKIMQKKRRRENWYTRKHGKGNSHIFNPIRIKSVE